MTSMTRRSLLTTAVAVGSGLDEGQGSFNPEPPATGSKPLKFRLGIVTYNIAAAWDLPTILKVCKNVGLSPVELRTTHKHGVEPSSSKAERKEVRQRFADAGIDVWGCGTVCEFHSPDPAVVQKNIETCKQF
ncbi:MAG TPA: sugar phosphate isomerase/epimerase, partial [Gemmataceae bacterium]|nr:sugar phosphate isomerase/epimerase [Gemmataceae bacterium]